MREEILGSITKSRSKRLNINYVYMELGQKL
jgi:hypothetical protein